MRSFSNEEATEGGDEERERFCKDLEFTMEWVLDVAYVMDEEDGYVVDRVKGI